MSDFNGNHPEMHALTGAYAVDAIDASEREAFEAHLATCQDCAAEVAEFRATAAVMSSLVETSPPAALRGGVLTAISQTRQLLPEIPTAVAPPGETTDTADPADADPTGTATTRDPSVTDLDGERQARRARGIRPWLAAAAAAVLLAVGGLIWQPWADNEPPPRQLTATEQVLRADDAQRIELPMNGSTIAIVRSPRLQRAVFVADEMPAPAQGKAFQLWYDLPGRGMVGAGLIPASGGKVTMMLEGDAGAATGAGITVEPAAGSQHPTSKPVALFAFSKA